MLVLRPNALPATVGAVIGFVELDAPEKTRLCAPVYAVLVLPYVSVAVIVIASVPPAVNDAPPVITSRVAVAALTTTVRRSVPVVVIAVAPEPPSVALATMFAV